jgi:ferredoxin
MAKIIQEHDKCIGCGSCVSLCSKYFEMGDDGKARPVDSEKRGRNYEKEIEAVECSKEAAEACPVQCIMVKE